MEKYISLKQVLDDLLEHPLLKDVSFERAVNHTVNFIRIIGMPRAFEEKTALIEIKDWRGLLPCDFNKIIQVRTHSECNNQGYRVFRGSTDSFHMSDNKGNYEDLTYKLQGNCIYTSMKEGTIEIAYEAIAVDSEGYPVIPDSSSFITALELYIKKKCFTTLFDLGQISPAVYQNVCQEYAWAVGQAQSDLVRPTIDQMESISNMWNQLIHRNNEHSVGFKTTGSREHINIQ